MTPPSQPLWNDDLAPLDISNLERGPAGPAGPAAQASAPADAPGPKKPADPPTERDLQRARLKDLVALTSQCAAEEARIETEFETAVAGEDKDYKHVVWTIEQRHTAAVQAGQQKYQQRTQHIRRKLEADKLQLAGTDKSRRQRVEQDRVAFEREVKQKLAKADWLAESVLEAEQIRVAQAYKKAKDDVAVAGVAVDDLESRTGATLVRFGRLPDGPVVVPPAEVKPPADSALTPDQVVTEAIAAHKAAIDAANAAVATVEKHLTALDDLRSPPWVVGGRPYVLGAFIIALAGGATLFGTVGTDVQNAPWELIEIVSGSAFVVSLVGGIFLGSYARRQIVACYLPLREATVAARVAITAQGEAAAQIRKTSLARAEFNRKNEMQAIRDALAPEIAAANKRFEAAIAQIDAETPRQRAHMQKEAELAQAEVTRSHNESQAQLDAKLTSDQAAALQKHNTTLDNIVRKRADERAALENHWTASLSRIQSSGGDDNGFSVGWDPAVWASWKTPKQFPPTVRFGELQVDLARLVEETLNAPPPAQSAVGTGQSPLEMTAAPEKVAPPRPFTLPLPPKFGVPALMAFPNQASLLIHSDRAGRAQAHNALRMLMTRLLTSLPAGRVRYTIIDPVGLGQNFAGFMHLADYDEALVSSRIWTDEEQITRRLTDLTEHMETVIQKYLRNEFATIDQYNQQAGELAEPYRFCVIADFPTNFGEESMRRLASIAASGPRCGVYMMIVRDTRLPLPKGAHLDDLESHSINLIRDGDRFAWKDDVFHRFPLSLDVAPSDEVLTGLLHRVGEAAKEANRVEVSFETIAPPPKQFWSVDSASDLHVPMGRSGATRLQMFRFGRGVAQHGLVAGKTGSGKSTLLNALITNIAMWYHPDQAEMYLIDFKKGVEFKTYATHDLPHARAIAVESDREFGLSVLQRLDAELSRRGALYRKYGVQDLAAFRAAAKDVGPMPRTILIIDEFQEFFSEDDKVAQEAGVLLDRLVRQGRAFGIHVLLGSQTISGSSGLARSTLGQMAVRIALQCSEADSQMILGDNNSAARLLSRPGEAIYNDAGGLVEGNSPFQIAWLPDDQREAYLDRVSELASKLTTRPEPPIVFEGNAPADISKNRVFMDLVNAAQYPDLSASSQPPRAWLGEPVAIKEPTAVLFRHQSGSNVLLVGQQEEAAMATLSSMILTLAAQHKPGSVIFYVLDGSPSDSPLSAVLPRTKDALPHDVRLVEMRSVPAALTELSDQLHARQQEYKPDAQTIYVLIYGLQRYRALRRSEDSYSSFSSSDEPKAPQPDKQFAELAKEGSSFGIHIMAWVDTLVSVDRAIDRNTLREFDNRLLFQMSAADSSTLIDSPAGNKLGLHRALLYSEEQGNMEKFRPYGAASPALLAQIKEKLSRR